MEELRKMDSQYMADNFAMFKLFPPGDSKKKPRPPQPRPVRRGIIIRKGILPLPSSDGESAARQGAEPNPTEDV